MNTSGFFIAMAVFVLMLIGCKTAKQEEMTLNPFLGNGVTKERVMELAAKYGLQDSVGNGYVSPYHSIPEEKHWPYLSEFAFEFVFSGWREFADLHSDEIAISKELMHISTIQEYYDVIEKYPHYMKMTINSRGGLEGYKAYKKFELSQNWHIYDRGGEDRFYGPLFIQAELDKGQYKHLRRMDKGPFKRD